MLLIPFALCAFGAAVYVTGMHDASNTVAVPVRTRALGERSALYLAALFNVLGVVSAFLLLGEYSATWVSAPEGETGLSGILAALLVCSIWGMLTWALRLPSSSTHALIGALAGVSWWARFSTQGSQELHLSSFLPHIFEATLWPLLYLPPLIFVLSWVMVIPFYRLVVGHNPRMVNQHSREVLAVSSSAISLLHGVQTGYLYLLLWSLMVPLLGDHSGSGGTYRLDTAGMLLGTLFIALTLGLGPLSGGRRIGYTFAYKMVRIDPLRGAVAQGTTAAVQILGYFLLQVPFSSSHLATASTLGAGVNQRFNALKPRIVLQILLVWIVTIPACFIVGVAVMMAVQALL